jgi:predicted transcriptional regulator
LDRKNTVLEIVEKKPGIRFNEIMRISNIKNGTLSHYVKKLADAGDIILEQSPRVTRMYPSGISKKETKICRHLTTPTQKNIILYLLKNKISTSIEIKDHLGKSPSVISVSLNELFKEKIISKKYDIPSNKYSLEKPEEIEQVLNEFPELFKK